MKWSMGLCALIALLTVSYTTHGQSRLKRMRKPVYEEVKFEDMVHRYFGKQVGTPDPVEGIYAVSCVITRRSKRFLSARERVKVVERKDNYARVAILKDWPGSSRDYIEVSMSYRDAHVYPIVGEVSRLSEGRGMIYKHIEPDGTVMSFSMTNEPDELIEGEYSFMQGRSTITYKISYLKTYPKSQPLVENASNH